MEKQCFSFDWQVEFFFLFFFSWEWVFLVNAEIDPVVVGALPGSQSIKLVVFNQGS